jgi:hypothetical protein
MRLKREQTLCEYLGINERDHKRHQPRHPCRHYLGCLCLQTAEDESTVHCTSGVTWDIRLQMLVSEMVTLENYEM